VADGQQSSFLDGLFAYSDQHNQLVSDLRVPLEVFADALDAAAEVVVRRKIAVITAATALIADGVVSTVTSVFTLGLSEAAYLAAMATGRELIKAALDALAAKLMSDLVRSSARPSPTSRTGCGPPPTSSAPTCRRKTTRWPMLSHNSAVPRQAATTTST
jgi:hypothetical protein